MNDAMTARQVFAESVVDRGRVGVAIGRARAVLLRSRRLSLSLRLLLCSCGRRRLRWKSLRAAIDAAVRHLHRHEHQVLINRHIALSAGTNHRSHQFGLRRIGDVINTDAVEISQKQPTALERDVRVREAQPRKHQLYRR